MPVAARTAIVALFLVVIAAVFVAHYLITGTSGFLPNSIGASTILFLKIGYDRFRDLDFTPPMWTALYGAGGPTAVGYATFNPILLLVSWVEPFANALVAYEVLLRVVGAFGCYCLLRRSRIALAPALAASGLFAFNFYSSAAGSDAQIGLAILALPWTLLALHATIERPGLVAALSLSAAMALFYLVSTIQIFSYTVVILFVPVTATIWWYCAPAAAGRFALARRSIWPLVYIAFAAVAALALTGFDLATQVQNLQVGLTTLDVSNATRDYVRLAPAAMLVAIALCAVSCSGSAGWRLVGAFGILLGYGWVYHVLDLSLFSVISANFGQASPSEFIFDLQRPRFFLSTLGAIMFLYGVGVQVRHGRTDRGLIVLVCVGAAYGMAALLFTPSTYYVRFAFVPLFGYSAFVALGVARLLERLREPLSRARWITVSAAIVVLFVGEAANLTLRQTIYTDSLKYTRLTSPEMAFLCKAWAEGAGNRRIRE